MKQFFLDLQDENSYLELNEWRLFEKARKKAQDWLATIAPEQWKEFLAFVGLKKLSKASKFTLALLEQIQQANLNGNALYLEDLLARVFKKQVPPRKDLRIKKLRDELKIIIQVVQNYLVQLELQKESRQQHKLLLLYLKRTNNYERFQEIVQKQKDQLEKEPLHLLTAEELWWLNHLDHSHSHTPHTDVHNSKFGDSLDAADQFTSLVSLRNYLEALNRNVKPPEAEMTYLRTKVQSIPLQSREYNALVHLYAQLIQLIEQYDAADYVRFNRLYKNTAKRLHPQEHLVIAKSMINLFYRLFSAQGEKKYGVLTFRWMVLAVRENLYQKEGSISEGDYLNFMLISGILKRFEVFKRFQQQMDPFLNSQTAKLVKGYCTARSQFDQQDYNAALATLHDYFPIGTSIDPLYDIRVKGLRILIYFEMLQSDLPLTFVEDKSRGLDLSDHLENSINALKQYCTRLGKRQLDDQLLNSNRRFVRIVKKMNKYLELSQLKTREAKQEKLALKIESLMQKDKPLAYRAWLNRTKIALMGQGR